jgi:hypothetical protein
MTSTLCQSAALGRIIAAWVAKIVELFVVTAKIILSMVENVSNSLHEPGVYCRRTGVAGAASPDIAMLGLPAPDDASGCGLIAGPRSGTGADHGHRRVDDVSSSAPRSHGNEAHQRKRAARSAAT